LFLAAEFEQGRAASLSRIESFLELVLDQHLQIDVKLFGQFLFSLGPVKEIAPEIG
jgi:hypothetical protein